MSWGIIWPHGGLDARAFATRRGAMEWIIPRVLSGDEYERGGGTSGRWKLVRKSYRRSIKLVRVKVVTLP